MVEASCRIIDAYLQIHAPAVPVSRLVQHELNERAADAFVATLIRHFEREEMHHPRVRIYLTNTHGPDNVAVALGCEELSKPQLLLPPAVVQLAHGQFVDRLGQDRELLVPQRSNRQV